MPVSDLSSIADTAIKIGGWAVSALMFVWIMSRRTQGWDRGNKAWLQLNGDKDSDDDESRRGLIEAYRSARLEDKIRTDRLENALNEVTERMRAVQDGLGAHGSRADIIAHNARRSISDAVAIEVRTTRRLVVESQWMPPDRPADSFPEPTDPSPPVLGPRRDPRRDPDDPSFRPEDTGRFRGRKKP